MRRSRAQVAVIAVLAVIALVALPVTAGAAPATLTGKVTGSVQLGSPLQYVSFNAFDFADAPDRGQVSYTNFEADEAGTGTWVPKGAFSSGVWNPGQASSLDFYLGSSGPYPHTMQFDSFTPLSYNSVAFKAHGSYGADPDFQWNATGTISGNKIDFVMEVTKDVAGYGWTRATAQGTINSAGQATGTATDNFVGPDGIAAPRTLTWNIAGALEEVRSFTAAVTCAQVSPDLKTASFTSVIPAGLGGGGNSFLITVTDNKDVPGVADTYNHGYASSGCATGSLYGPYPVTGGNLTVHK